MASAAIERAASYCAKRKIGGWRQLPSSSSCEMQYYLAFSQRQVNNGFFMISTEQGGGVADLLNAGGAN